MAVCGSVVALVCAGSVEIMESDKEPVCVYSCQLCDDTDSSVISENIPDLWQALRVAKTVYPNKTVMETAAIIFFFIIYVNLYINSRTRRRGQYSKVKTCFFNHKLYT